MKRLLQTFRLTNSSIIDDVVRSLAVSRWSGVDRVSPGKVCLSRTASRIDATDPVLPKDSGSSWSKFVLGFRFDEDDQTGGEEVWYPQGLTGSADADESGYVDGRKFLMVSWYCRYPGMDRLDVALEREGEGTYPHPFKDPAQLLDRACSRISLIDVTDFDDLRYRHILLVEPILNEEGRADFVALVERDVDGNPKGVAHCGGCVWFGRWLYVCTGGELMVFDMDLLSDIEGQNADYGDSTSVGWDGRKYHAFGYRYVLPLVIRYRFESLDERVQFGEEGGPFSALGLDRSAEPPQLIASKYVVEAGRDDYESDPWARVAICWSLNDHNGTLADLDAADAYLTRALYVQGVSAGGATMWFSASDGDTHRLEVRTTTGSGYTRYAWPAGAEGVTYSPNSDNLWCVTEYPDRRICFCVDRATVDR